MFQNLDVFRTAMSMARHAGHMQALSAQNIANADTPGYRGKDLPAFKESLAGKADGQRATRARHLHGTTGRDLAAEDRRRVQDPNGNTVSLELELIKSVDASRQHNRALAIYRNNLSILRASLGRG